MAQYLIPPDGISASIAPSLHNTEPGIRTDASNQSILENPAAPLGDVAENAENGVADPQKKTFAPHDTLIESNNPTVVPSGLLQQFHFAFLIRHPQFSVPSYFRCTVPPLDRVTGFYDYAPSEAGYRELRLLFDYLRQSGQIGPQTAEAPSCSRHHANGVQESRNPSVEICVIDADDMLDDPNAVIAAFCKSVGIEFNLEMLGWDNEEDQRVAQQAFAKWHGFHDDVIESKGLKPRTHVSY